MAPALYSNAVISIERLTHRFGENTVLDGVTLEVEAGEIVAIMGSSGGGKTTLLRCVSGLLRPTSGKVTVDGIDAVRQPEAARRTMGMVFQASALFDYLSVRENVLFGLRRWSDEPRAVQDRRAEEVLELVGMADA
ncbi:MAG: ATP-binding cassette domain-containing protein, partial [Fimbriimonas ginsengisoli]|nr:ATP-binding cassette domain-containing protein [Fimbriimonas ginsengisoli]